MTPALAPSPLRLPQGQPKPVAELVSEGPRACLEVLAGRRFSGRVSFQRGDHLAEVLIRGGQPLVATLLGPDGEPARAGQEALNGLTALPTTDWSCQVEPLDPSLL